MMRKFFSMLAVCLLVAACAGQEESPTAGTGGPSPGAGAGPAPGTVAEFVQEVGDRVFFGFDRYDLTPEARTTLDAQAAWLQQYPAVEVVIEGHADERGTRAYNLALGERRATAVRNYLVALGVAPNRIETVSYGKERPIDPRSNEEAWARNRRAVTTITEGAPTS
ncbi:MAG: peptidoglycan-associated lipoprotein Pal [Alphaproteobacteria bacterium]|jgi:peptidoglycan-associated lipoprotein|nr:peptidoglycan-associated lipoprotein Pal [Alphaproteobacteria bacterium]